MVGMGCYSVLMSDDKAKTMKSAYELALERMEGEGIERPRELSEDTRRQIQEIRQKADAKLAEVQILHRDRLKRLGTLEARDQEEEDYLLERRRIEAERDQKIKKLRGPD